jgi:tellurite resistance protein TehA-like permease
MANRQDKAVKDVRMMRFYLITVCFITTLILFTLLAKTVIWVTAKNSKENDYKYPIHIRKYAHLYYKVGNSKYTTVLKQKLYNKVDYLLTPAFTMSFVVIATKLIRMPDVFGEQE